VQRFDLVVVGGGSAGCVLAARLSEEPERSVCLVEAGPDYGPYDAGAWPADILDGRQLAFSHAWETDREDRSQLRARIIGGCSAHNACVALEGDPEDYEWGDGWSYAALEPYFRRAERELRVRRFSAEELSPWHRAFDEARPDDVVVTPLNAVDGVRWNAAFAYLDPARGRANLTILAETLVDRVDAASGRVYTSRGELEAETLVLAAGAYGSPGILLRSGIDAGAGLIDHVGVGFGWEATADLLAEAADFEAANPLYMAGVAVRPDRDLFVFPAIESGYEISAAVFDMKPRSRGTVSLTSNDPEAPLRIEHGFLTDPHDAELLERGVELVRELLRTEPLRRYAAREVRPGPEVTPAEHVRSAARGFFHPVGTCAIGRVVDGRGRVHGAERIVVADASIMPEIPRAPVNLTVIAVAERLAELL
jgi:choline dehydrogenase